MRWPILYFAISLFLVPCVASQYVPSQVSNVGLEFIPPYTAPIVSDVGLELLKTNNLGPTLNESLSTINISYTNNFTSQFNCSDPNGDELSYSSNDSRVVIDSSTGVFTNGSITRDDIGVASINLTCSDEEFNASSTFNYEISVAHLEANVTLCTDINPINPFHFKPGVGNVTQENVPATNQSVSGCVFTLRSDDDEPGKVYIYLNTTIENHTLKVANNSLQSNAQNLSGTSLILVVDWLYPGEEYNFSAWMDYFDNNTVRFGPRLEVSR